MIYSRDDIEDTTKIKQLTIRKDTDSSKAEENQ